MDPLLHANLYLTTTQHVDPRVVTERTGLAMDSGFSLGDVRRSRPAPSKVSMWVHGSGEFERTVDLQGLINRFLDPIEAVAPELSAVRREFAMTARITLNIQLSDGDTPDGTLSASTLARLVALDIDLDLDLYP